MEVVDAQVHVCTADSPQPPFPPGSTTYLHRDIPSTPDALLARMAEAGVTRAVLVPPTWERHGNTLAVDAAVDHAGTFTVTAPVDLGDPGWQAALAAWPEPGIAAYRLILARPHELERWEDGTAETFLAEAERRGVPVALNVQGRLAIAKDVVSRHPDLRVVVDHMGLSTSIRIDDAAPLVDELIELARWPNVAVKASALPANATDAYPFASLHEPIYRVVDAFGPERVFWGSDMTRLPCSYREAVTMFTEGLDRLASSDLELIMGRGLLRWLDWD